MEMNIAVIPGDGIGPEITTAAIIVLEAIAEKYGHVLNLQYVKACSQSVEESGEPLPKEALETCLQADAVLLGNTGLEKYKSAFVKTAGICTFKIKKRTESNDKYTACACVSRVEAAFSFKSKCSFKRA